MQTVVKTPEEIVNMRESGRMLATVLDVLKKKIAHGMTTWELDEIARAELKALGGEPAFLGYNGFPSTLCVSVNDEVVHGMPSKDFVVHDGDLVSLDFGVNYKGMITDSAISVFVGKAQSQRVADLVAVTERSLFAGIDAISGDGVRVGDIASAIQAVIEEKPGYGIIRDLVGHGVGHHVHEEPNIPNYGFARQGPSLKAGMTIAIEPMVTLGTHKITIDNDGWTIRTADGSWAAHFEHTVLITDDGAEILTQI